MKKIFISLFIISILSYNVYVISLRLHLPVSVSTNECNFNNVTYSCEPSSTGYSLRAIFGIFGIGYTSSVFEYGYPASLGFDKFKVTSNALDLSGSFIDGLITIGVGSIIDGNTDAKQPLTYGGTMEITGGKNSGTTSFLNLAFDVGPLEIIGGYRMWDVTAKEQDIKVRFPAPYNVSNSDSKSTDGMKSKYNEMTLGVGIKF